MFSALPPNVPSPLRDYRLAVEQEYCDVIVQLLKAGQEHLRVEDLIKTGLPNAKREVLNHQLGRYQLDSITAFTVELEVCHSLLYYLQEVRHIRNQKITLVGQAILDHERVRFGLTCNSANAINAILLIQAPPILPSINVQALEQYDQHLAQAIQQEGILSKEIRAELRLLQLVLGIADHELPPPEKLQTERGINYIPLWRLLKQKDWKAANQETYRCLLLSSGRKERDTQVIDIERISLRDLQTIDLLWQEFSNGRFGFSVQLSIWRATMPDLECLGKELDWRRNHSWIGYDFVDFSLDAAKGHLPILPHVGWWCWVGGMTSLLDKVAQFQQFDPQNLPESQNQ